MSGAFTKAMARNIFYGGTVFFFLLFLALSFDTHSQLPKRDMRQNITPQIAEGKKLWEVNNCIGCHTLMGEGAYFAPELGNVVARGHVEITQGERLLFADTLNIGEDGGELLRPQQVSVDFEAVAARNRARYAATEVPDADPDAAEVARAYTSANPGLELNPE